MEVEILRYGGGSITEIVSVRYYYEKCEGALMKLYQVN